MRGREKRIQRRLFFYFFLSRRKKGRKKSYVKIYENDEFSWKRCGTQFLPIFKFCVGLRFEKHAYLSI